MVYKFEKIIEMKWNVEIEANSLDEAKKILNDNHSEWDADHNRKSCISTSRCLQYRDRDDDEYIVVTQKVQRL
jgi:hypothetical protein